MNGRPGFTYLGQFIDHPYVRGLPPVDSIRVNRWELLELCMGRLGSTVIVVVGGMEDQHKFTRWKGNYVRTGVADVPQYGKRYRRKGSNRGQG